MQLIPKSCCRLHAKSVAYAATSLGAHLINPIFSFYYVKVYLNRFHVTENWFQLAQLVFMIWNAINDPLFGCLQDNAPGWLAALRSRRHSILYGAPLFVVAFIVPWFPWTDYDAVNPSPPPWIAGLQLMFSLCFYDALFTFVLLAQCALFTELSVEQTDRVRLVRYHHAAGLIGSASVLICETMSDGLRAYGRFQMTCIGLGLAAGLCFVYTGLHSQTPFDRQKQQQQQQAGVDDDRDKKTDTMSAIQQQPSLSIAAVWRQTRQIFRQPSFVSFILMNLCQVYHMAFLHNFANIIGESLLGKDGISAAAKSIFYGSLFVIPQLLVIICAPVVSSLGYYRLIRGSFVLNISMGLLFLIVGHRHPWFVVLFFLVESASVNSMFSLFGLCLSDVIDVDMQQHQRTRPLSSMVFGLNALVTKPSISLAPMITVAILNRYGYSERQKQQQLVPSATALTTLVALDQSADSLLAAMFYTTCLVSIITGLLQLVLWRFYTIRDSHKPSYQLIFTD